jgi:hypothetical protein
MKTWKKAVLWVFAIVLLVVAIGAAYLAGFRQGKIEEICTQLDFNLGLNAAHYSILKGLETDELAQNRKWRQVMGNLSVFLYSMVCFVDQNPGYFVYEGQRKESFERDLQKARKITEEVDPEKWVSLRQISEEAMGTTNLTVKRGRDFIRFSRNEEEK